MRLIENEEGFFDCTENGGYAKNQNTKRRTLFYESQVHKCQETCHAQKRHLPE